MLGNHFVLFVCVFWRIDSHLWCSSDNFNGVKMEMSESERVRTGFRRKLLVCLLSVCADKHTSIQATDGLLVAVGFTWLEAFAQQGRHFACAEITYFC